MRGMPSHFLFLFRSLNPTTTLFLLEAGASLAHLLLQERLIDPETNLSLRRNPNNPTPKR
jgi:hypothetical protein